MVPWIETHDPLPRTSQALGPDSDAPGLLAAGSDLSNTRLEQAYRRGIFPWFGVDQPVLWWSPDPRMVLFLDEFKLSRSLAKTLRRVRRTREGARARKRAAGRARRPRTAYPHSPSPARPRPAQPRTTRCRCSRSSPPCSRR
jgi:hypothetical protein